MSGLILADAARVGQLVRMPDSLKTLAMLLSKKATLQKWLARLSIMRIPGALADEGLGLPTNQNG